jgi:hypothetical protein
MPNYGINVLSGVLGGFGGFGTAVGAAGEEARKEALKREALRMEQQKIDDERQYRDAALTIQRDTQVGQSVPLGQVFKAAGLDLQAGMDPAMRVPNTVADKLITDARGQQTRQEEMTQGGAMATGIGNRYGDPETAVGATGPQRPTIADPIMGQLADILAVGGYKPALAPVIEAATKYEADKRMQEAEAVRTREILSRFGFEGSTPGVAPPGQGPTGGREGTATPGPSVPAAQGAAQPRGSGMPGYEDPTLALKAGTSTITLKGEPPNYRYIHGALAEAGYTPSTPGYNTEFSSLLQQPVPMAAGGKATTRTEGIRPPSFYAPGGPGAGGLPPSARFRGEPAVVPDVVAHDVAQAVAVRHSTNQMYEALKNPDIVNNYIGPYAQYWSAIQGRAPFEAAGKKPPDLVALEQNLSNLTNYTIRLITGAAVREAEEPRIKGQLPQMSNQPDEFKQRLTWTIKNNELLENQVRALALQGDTNAKAVAAELGLDRINVIDQGRLGAPGAGTIESNRNATVPPKVPPGAHLEGRDVVSDDGRHIWSGGQWQPRR